MAAFAVALLSLDHHDIERGEGFLQLEPGLSATTGGVMAERVFGDETLIACAAGGQEGGLDLLGGGCVMNGDEVK